MKKNIIITALIVAIGLMAAACQKEHLFDSPQREDVSSYSEVVYSVDGVMYTEVLKDEESWFAFLRRAFALAEEGHVVVITHGSCNDNRIATKDTVTYTTSDINDATNWCNKMREEGYEITIVYDMENNKYICTAIK